jgi:uncharacterized membrane protein
MIDDNIINLNESNDENNNNYIDDDTQNKIGFIIIIILCIFIVQFNLYQVFYIIRLIKRAYISLPLQTFEECYLYNGLTDLLLEFYSFFLGIDLLFLCLFPFFNDYFDRIYDKYNAVFYYLNYFIFGPLTIAIIFLCIAHCDKLMYTCVRFRPENKIFNFKLIFFICISSMFSLLITAGGIYYFGDNYFTNSITLNPSGNQFLGYMFWKFGITRSRRIRQRLNQNNNNQIVNNEENINLIN